ncbi:MAG: hypothetical protein Q9163_005555 [Psora crenata]
MKLQQYLIWMFEDLGQALPAFVYRGSYGTSLSNLITQAMEGYTSRQNLLDYLRKANPILNKNRCRGRGCTKSRQGKWNKPRKIEEWHDFTYDTLQVIFGGDLQRLLQRQKDGPKTLLPADTKLSHKWSSKEIIPGEYQAELGGPPPWMLPLSQVFTYCVNANARYGYIITDEELLVLRVRPYVDMDQDTQSSTESQTQTYHPAQYSESSVEDPESIRAEAANKRTGVSGVLEYRAIPWKKEDWKDWGVRRVRRSLRIAERKKDTENEEDQEDREMEDDQEDGEMTINLALWWLHMLARGSNDIQDYYPDLRDQGWNERLTKSKTLPNANQDSKAPSRWYTWWLGPS